MNCIIKSGIAVVDQELNRITQNITQAGLFEIPEVRYKLGNFQTKFNAVVNRTKYITFTQQRKAV